MPPRGSRAAKKKALPSPVEDESPPPSEPQSPPKTGSKRKAAVVKKPTKVVPQKRAKKSR